MKNLVSKTRETNEMVIEKINFLKKLKLNKLVTDELYDAVEDAFEFELLSIYKYLICGKIMNGGSKIETVNTALKNLDKIKMTDEDKKFFLFLHDNISHSVCCLPKNHKGKCKSSYQTFFSPNFANKVKDCYMSPGDDDIIFKNRTRRNFPIQISNTQEASLKKEFDLKRTSKLKAAIPIKHAATPFLIATTEIDFASMLIQVDKNNTVPEDIKNPLQKNFERLTKDFENYINPKTGEKDPIYIINKEGKLCCPVMGNELLPEYFTIDDTKNDNQIQFGHCESLLNNKYMTRGGNIIVITRRGNLIQSNDSLCNVKHILHHAYEHTNGF
ncbi:hypothetical protein KAZ01_03005 [Candidatus Gracilibacteria bacterium]|nr:hypothetical protein [Candidatus Gracilibacteria bacterium]